MRIQIQKTPVKDCAVGQTGHDHLALSFGLCQPILPERCKTIASCKRCSNLARYCKKTRIKSLGGTVCGTELVQGRDVLIDIVEGVTRLIPVPEQ